MSGWDFPELGRQVARAAIVAEAFAAVEKANARAVIKLAMVDMLHRVGK